jgi:CheY-like chemotaxis protein
MCVKNLRFLVVDDSPDVREMVETALKLKGYQVNGVGSGQEALERVNEANKSHQFYDAVLLDYAMPGMDGLTCALKIREEEPRSCPQVKLGFFTAHEELTLPNPILNKLKAKSWSKMNLVEMVNDIDHWVEFRPCGPEQTNKCAHKTGCSKASTNAD